MSLWPVCPGLLDVSVNGYIRWPVCQWTPLPYYMYLNLKLPVISWKYWNFDRREISGFDENGIPVTLPAFSQPALIPSNHRKKTRQKMSSCRELLDLMETASSGYGNSVLPPLPVQATVFKMKTPRKLLVALSSFFQPDWNYLQFDERGRGLLHTTPLPSRLAFWNCVVNRRPVSYFIILDKIDRSLAFSFSFLAASLNGWEVSSIPAFDPFDLPGLHQRNWFLDFRFRLLV